jgi:hypothetical protein
MIKMNFSDLSKKASVYGFSAEVFKDEYRVFYIVGNGKNIVVTGSLDRCCHILDNY